MQEWEKKFDELALSRGRGLWKDGKVADIRKSDSDITAAVMGVPRCEVSIVMRERIPCRLKCRCPKYRGGRNCEHMAAVLYAVYGDPDGERKEAEVRREAEERERIRAAKQERMRRHQEQQAKEKAKLEAQQQARERERREAEEKKAAEEAERMAQEAARKAAAEAAQKEAAEAAARMKEEEERKKQQGEAAKVMRDDYCYFDFDAIRMSMGMYQDDYDNGHKLFKNGKIKLREVTEGYLRDGSGEAVIEATGYGNASGRVFWRLQKTISKIRKWVMRPTEKVISWYMRTITDIEERLLPRLQPWKKAWYWNRDCRKRMKSSCFLLRLAPVKCLSLRTLWNSVIM